MKKKNVIRTQSEPHSITDPFDELLHTIENLNLRQMLVSSKKERWAALCSACHVTGGVFQALLFATLRLNWHVIGSIYQVSQRVTLEHSTLHASSWHFCLLLARSELCNDTFFFLLKGWNSEQVAGVRILAEEVIQVLMGNYFYHWLYSYGSFRSNT
jgi:hypothetical protein